MSDRHMSELGCFVILEEALYTSDENAVYTVWFESRHPK